MNKIIETENEKLDLLAKVLDGYIPICARCKAIRTEEGAWEPVEKYLTDKSESVKFSHGLCTSCYEIEIKDIENYQQI